MLLFPAILIGAMIYIHKGGDFGFVSQSPVIYNNLLDHNWIMALFIPGNILVFALAGMGLIRFWKALKARNDIPENAPGFISALISTIIDIVLHKRFRKCDENNRSTTHIMVLYGFLGAAATAGLAVVLLIMYGLKIPGGELSPLGGHTLSGLVMHPVKWLGNLSGIAGSIGILILVVKRVKAGGGYPDWIFLLMLTLVFLTGMFLQVIRLSGNGAVAYISYYIHMILVFFVLFYAPYSKLAHMFYRTLAMVFAKMIGRVERE